MKEFVYVVEGISRHFSGDCNISIVGVRRDAIDARNLGFEWSKERNETYKFAGKNIHASYKLHMVELK